jgi:hypothetical protein
MKNKNPAIAINGINIQSKITNNPNKTTKARKNIPATIKIILIPAPKTLEKVLEKKVLKNSPTAKPLG